MEIGKPIILRGAKPLGPLLETIAQPFYTTIISRNFFSKTEKMSARFIGAYCK
jgi:hypothetical protein